MNRNQIINLTVLLSVIVFIIIIRSVNKIIKYKRYNTIQNKINSKIASEELIKLAYQYETGKYPFETNKQDGTKLEYTVFKTLYRCGGKILSNVYTGIENNNTNESDVVFVHNTGIYVIECKDSNAVTIEGNGHDKNLTYIFNEDYREDRYNPLKQNLGHINSLKNMLSNKSNDEYYVSLIVMSCKNINVTYESNVHNFYQYIVTPKKLESHIESLINNRKIVFTDEEVLDIYKYLHENCSNTSEEIKEEHRINIKNILRDDF